MPSILDNLYTSFMSLFESDENIWALALIALAVVFLFMMVKSIVLSVIRRLKNRAGHN